MIRTLSYSEIQTALTCEARHAYRYTGRLSGGDALKPRVSAPALRDGKAWGRGVATWHEHGLKTDGLVLAQNAIDESLAEDADEQIAAGVHDPADHERVQERLLTMIVHYTTGTEPLGLYSPERELDVPLPSRTGARPSNRYRLQVFLDGLRDDESGRPWLVEFKLRRQLSRFEIVEKQRQLRWSAWAARQTLGLDIAGVLVDERLNEVPKPPRLVRSKKKVETGRFDDAGKAITDYVQVPSHTADQLCTPDAYRIVCAEHGVEPVPETLQALRARRWQARHPILFRRGELDEAGAELVSAARLISELDPGGSRYPIRNAGQMTCPGCAFLGICSDPLPGVIDMTYDRRPPKKDRLIEEEVAA